MRECLRLYYVATPRGRTADEYGDGNEGPATTLLHSSAGLPSGRGPRGAAGTRPTSLGHTWGCWARLRACRRIPAAVVWSWRQAAW